MVHRGIFSRAFWREYRLSLLRSRRDSSSRKMFLRLNFMLLVAIAWVGYQAAMLHSLHDTGTTIGIVAILVVILTIIAAVRWSQRREAQKVLAVDIASAPAGVVARLQHLTHGLAALQERALSEIYLHEHELPKDSEAITRRIQIGALKKRGSWDQLPLPVRDRLAQPDGAWTKPDAIRVTLFAETLHSLLWAQGLISRLRPLDGFIDSMNFSNLARALQKPARGILPTWELRGERNAANLYYSRCFAEQVHRGEIHLGSEDQQATVDGWIKDIQEGNSREFFAGSSKVSELEQIGLQRVSHSAAQRTAILNSVMNLLDGEDDWSNLEGVMFAAVNVQPDNDLEMS